MPKNEKESGNFVIGTTLLELRYTYFVIGKSKILFLLHNSYCVIKKVADPSPKDLRDEIALAKPFALANGINCI